MIAGMVITCGICIGGIVAGIFHDISVTRKLETELKYVTRRSIEK